MTSRTAAPLVLLGAGGFARETAAAVHALNGVRPTWDLLGFLDDDPRLSGVHFEGVPVLGPLALLAEHPDAFVVACTGSPSNYFSRKRIVRRLGLPDERFATIVHPRATLAGSVEVGAGSVVLAGVVGTASARAGRHVAVMPQAVITHDVEIGDFVTIAAGVCLGGSVVLGEGAYIGSGALVREGVRVGPWSLLGMGSLATGDVPAGEVWFGAPARRRRAVDVPDEVLSPLGDIGRMEPVNSRGQ